MPRKRKGNPVHGWVVLDKPYRLGSTSAVGKLRWLFTAQKAGHAGTLDPLATGILPIALGEATKTVPFMMDARKGYQFTLTFGENTDTWDTEGTVTETSDVRPTEVDILQALPQFIGDIEQIPPRFSAIKVDGKRSYDLARSGEVVELKSRQVTVESFELLSYDGQAASFEVACGKGTYIRSLARDLAAALSACGHVTMLRRTRVGPFTLAQSFTLDALEKLCHRGGVSEALRPVETALDDIPVLAITEIEANELKHGRAIVLTPSLAAENPDWILAMEKDKAVALCRAIEGQLRPKKVFNL
ncbi:tRNA pseudouridine(55) synthase TruB [Hellea sp.]|nr:tRNA pseudouridine(55) synthase TruB [Hellea sp.]